LFSIAGTDSSAAIPMVANPELLSSVDIVKWCKDLKVDIRASVSDSEKVKFSKF